MKTAILLAGVILLTGCANSPEFEEGSYLCFDKAEYAGKLLQWVGLAAEGSYCQITSSELAYEWTAEDMDFLLVNCPENSNILGFITAEGIIPVE